MQPNQPAKPTGPGPQPPYHAPEYTIDPNLPPAHASAVPPPATNPNDGHTGHNPYEFIMAPKATPKRSFSLNLGGSSFIKRIALIVGGAIVLMIVAGVVLSALTPKGSTPGLTAIAQRQQEIVRVSNAAGNQATGQDTLNFVTNVNISIASSQQQVLSYLTSHGTKLDPKLLAADADSQTDDQLASAASANNYDAAVVQNLTAQLQAYEILLQNTYKETSNKTTKTLLQTCFNSATKLVQQAKSIQTASN